MIFHKKVIDGPKSQQIFDRMRKEKRGGWRGGAAPGTCCTDGRRQGRCAVFKLEELCPFPYEGVQAAMEQYPLGRGRVVPGRAAQRWCMDVRASAIRDHRRHRAALCGSAAVCRGSDGSDGAAQKKKVKRKKKKT